MRREIQRDERMKRHLQVCRPVAAIDDRRRADDRRTRGFDGRDGFPGRKTRRDDVLDDDHAIARFEAEPAPERHLPVLPLDENRAQLQAAPHFVTDDEPAHGWRQYDRRRERPQTIGECAAQGFGVRGMLEHQRTLEVPRTVQPRRQLEVPVQEGA